MQQCQRSRQALRQRMEASFWVESRGARPVTGGSNAEKGPHHGAQVIAELLFLVLLLLHHFHGSLPRLHTAQFQPSLGACKEAAGTGLGV